MAKKKKKRNLKNEESLRNILDNIKCNNIYIIGTPEGKESKKEVENLFKEILTENFPSLVRKRDTQSRKQKES